MSIKRKILIVVAIVIASLCLLAYFAGPKAEKSITA